MGEWDICGVVFWVRGYGGVWERWNARAFEEEGMGAPDRVGSWELGVGSGF